MSNDDDMIRRGDALRSIERTLNNATGDLYDAYVAIAALPAASTQTRIDAAVTQMKAERDAAVTALSNPVAVHANILRGIVATPILEQLIHLYGRKTFQPMIDAAVAAETKRLQKALKLIEMIGYREGKDWG